MIIPFTIFFTAILWSFMEYVSNLYLNVKTYQTYDGSEMGAHFSPCGRFLAACVACVLPRVEPDPGLPSQVQHDVTGVATSPTRHPISAHQVMYELRIYSLEKAT